MDTNAGQLASTVDELLDALPPIWDRIRSRLRSSALARFDITLEQFHALRHIRRGCRSVGEIAERRQVSRSAVSQAVDALVSKHLVTRTQESEDRRCVLLTLTPRASEAMDANWEQNRTWVAERLSGLSVEDLECVGRAMGILKEAFVPDSDPRS